VFAIRSIVLREDRATFDRIFAVKIERVLSGHLLKEARLRAGLSQATLACRAGKPTSVIGRWERGEVKPSLETLQQLINACELELRVGLAELDESQDAAIDLSLELTVEERFDRLSEWANFLAEGRESLRVA
jgi:transcriptional regulator with XRE-family HTH domain